MGSQTLDILRQGVWASLTGGWFYDPHQGVFCNVVHLYLWLFLLCAPFVAYLYFPGTWLTWCIYCLLTSLTIFLVKLVNMALHRLYDRAQTMSESNFKNQFFKITKETEAREDETGIEMKVMRNDGSRNSVEQAINEASEEMLFSMSMENVNSIIDLKVDVHRKNSSESIELMFYAPSMTSANSQQDQQSLAGSASVSKSLRSSTNAAINSGMSGFTGVANNEISTKYLTVYPEHENELAKAAAAAAAETNASGKLANTLMTASTTASAASAIMQRQQQPHLLRKSSEDFKRRQQRRRLERQRSLDAAVDSGVACQLMRNHWDTIEKATRNETFLHSFGKTGLTTTMATTTVTTTATTNTTSNFLTTNVQQQQQRLNATKRTIAGTLAAAIATTNSNSASPSAAYSISSSGGGGSKNTRLQRHRSSETHDERLKHQNRERGLFLPIHHEQQQHHHHRQQQQTLAHAEQHPHHHHLASGASSSGALASRDMLDNDEMDLNLGGSASVVAAGAGAHGNLVAHRVRGALLSWILDSSSDIDIDDDNYTKSDFGIEQLDSRGSANANSGAALLLQQQQQLNSHYHQQQYRLQQPHAHHHHHHHHHHHGGANIRKNSNSTMSALQLSVTTPAATASTTANANTDAKHANNSSGAAASSTGTGIKRRRHSNASTTLFKSGTTSAATVIAAAALAASGQQATVRRIKSAALEISCPRPSVSNLSPHPNSVEAINGQQQIRNPPSALLPPPSKCLVRNAHLNLCPKFGGSLGSGSSLNFGDTSAAGSTTALIEPVYPIKEQADEKTSLDSAYKQHSQNSSGDLEITDIDAEDEAEDAAGEADVDADAEDIVDDDLDIDHELGMSSAAGIAVDVRRDDNDNDVDADADDDDAVDDVPMRRRHKALGCRGHRHSAESDVGDILGDDDEFKDFDDDLEHILSDLQQTQSRLEMNLKATHAAQQQERKTRRNELKALDSDDDDLAVASSAAVNACSMPEDDDGPSTSQALRQRLHSTDSETDNNGSRSPLLSKKTWSELTSNGAAKAAADKAIRIEIAAVQQQKQKLKQANANFPAHLYDIRGANASNLNAKRDGDSGCPSSDCEQVSASSKDMLLAGLDAPEMRSDFAAREQMAAKDIEQGSAMDATKQQQDSNTATTSNNAAIIGKSLGAIPKVVKYREIDETCSSHGAARESAQLTSAAQLHKRRGDNSNSSSSNGNAIVKAWLPNNAAGTTTAATKPTANSSRTSSSTSSRSISADSFSADIHKMLWLMHGGTVDERGRPVAGIGPDGAPVTVQPHVVPPNMSTAHFQFYQDALQAFNTYPANSSDGLSVSERLYFRDKIRRSSKQISEPGNSFISEFSSHAHDLHSAQLSSTSQGAVVAGSAAAAVHSGRAAQQSHDVLTAPPTTSLNAITVINVGRNLTQARADNSNSGVGTTAAAILNVDGHHIENYCDYWRPAMLSAEKPVIPKSFYKYRFKCCGYEHEFKISMDRLELLALFDRDLHWLHIFLAVALCAIVAYLGATILQHGYYKDLFAFLFCAVIAGSQYSLVKSVQPDAASPIHGFNKTVAYSRAIYFSVCGGLLLLLEQLKRDYEQHPPATDFKFFGIHYSPVQLTLLLLHIMYVVLLCFPLIFSLGLFPQINTFLMYLLEQVDMHVFGGNAAGSLLGSFLCVLRSLLGILILYGPLYAALAEAKGTQFILFSIFCAMLIPLGYHLSRSASEFSHLWALVKTCIVSTYRDDDDELSAATASAESSQKLTSSTPKQRHKNDNSNKEPVTNNTVSNEHIEMSSLEKLPTAATYDEQQPSNLERKISKSKASSLSSSSQTLGKTLSSSKKAITASNSYASVGNAAAVSESAAANAPVEHTLLNISSKSNERLDAANNIEEAAAISDNVAMQRFAENEAVKPTADVEEDDDDKISNSSTTNPGDISTLTAGGATGAAGLNNGGPHDNDNESPDPLPKKLQNTVNTRLKNDLVVTTILAVVVLGLHCSTVFTVLQPDLNIVLYAFTGALGLLLHYFIPQMRKHMPWLCFARPILRQKEFGQFEVANAPKVMWFEKVYIYLCMVERNVMFPLLVISALTADAQVIANKFGIAWGTLIVAVCALKFIRNAYSDPTNQYLIVMFTVLFFRIDFAVASETFLIDYFFVSLAFRKCCDFLLKLQFVVTYIAPWQITWGSAFHAFAQPFSVPHSAMLFLQAAISAILSTPLNPFLGSAIFLTSYVRPIKFWERDYNTRRIDHSNTRLSSQLERDLGADDNNLNSIFYEHLTRSLQHSLCGDLLMGRWGNVNQGDCFVLASDYLNCLVHIIELGNGLCTFQMRGLEFRGTYCQQREVEAITEDVEDNDGCCCCDPGHLPRMLSMNAMFSTRWLAWQVVAAQYVLEGYSISDNLASATLQVFEYRKVLITYYIKSIIYYVIKNPKLEQWLASGPIQDALQHTLSRQFVDLDPIFNYNLDEDFDFRAIGITRGSFCYIYLSWINFCCDKRKENQNPPTTPVAPATPSAGAGAAANTTGANNTSSTAAAAYNDSKSTPNLSTQQVKSLSQQQLRARPQKSATMSGSGSATVNNHSSTEHMATSQSFANISRQTSESAPGLTLGYASSSAAHAPLDTSLNQSAVTVGSSAAASRIPLGQLRTSKLTSKAATRKEDSPTTEAGGRSASVEAERADKPTIKLKVPTIAKDSPIVSLCLALGLLARRSLATASHSSLTGVEFFLHGLHALFKGDFRITSPRDEWVFADMELLHAVVAPAVKMALKLQQDHISNPDEFLDPNALYEAIDTCSKDLVISHEADPVWRSAVLRGAPNLLALRHVMEDGSDEYRIIRLTKRFLSFRVIKLNRECVRGLWAGQQQELIYLRNRNPERGSIQNAKQALRNIINSSCDQPIGYPIYVSPLTTSYADTNEQLSDVIGGAITLESIKSNILDWWQRIRERCRQGCSSGSAMEASNLGVVAIGAGPTCNAGGESGEIASVYISAPLYNTLTVGNFFGLRSGNVPPSMGGSLGAQFGSDGLTAMRSGLAVMPVKPTSTTLLAGLLNREQEREREARLGVGIRKSQTQNSGTRIDRERRATLPIASTSIGGAANVAGGSVSTATSISKDANADASQLLEKDNASSDLHSNSSPRYAKISCSSDSLGIGNIITTPGDYPRKSKGPICLTAAAAAIAADGARTSADLLISPRKPRIELYKKVIIVDDTEIYNCLDMVRCLVMWPSEEMRANGGSFSWKDWVPHAGMVGYVVHFWIPNHVDQRFRSHINCVVYLIEIGQHYVPVGEYGLREYNQIVSSSEELSVVAAAARAAAASSSRSSSMQRELDSLQQREGLTPILGSSLESPTSQLASTSRNSELMLTATTSSSGSGGGGGGVVSGTAIADKRKMKAVSSSSSEDEEGLMNYKIQRCEILFNMWKIIADQKNENNMMCDTTSPTQLENVILNNEPKIEAEKQQATPSATTPQDEQTELILSEIENVIDTATKEALTETTAIAKRQQQNDDVTSETQAQQEQTALITTTTITSETIEIEAQSSTPTSSPTNTTFSDNTKDTTNEAVSEV